jgi:hypothetical protein
VDATSSQRHAGISRSVIKKNGVSILADGLTTWKDDIANIASSLVWGFWPKNPGITALQAHIWLLKIEQSESQAIDAS